MSITLTEKVRALLDGRNYGTVATINPDGSPQTSVVWVARDGDDLLFSTTMGRVKARNIAHDPRVSVTVLDSENPYSYAEIRGIAQVTEEGGRKLINDLSLKYNDTDYPVEPPETVRIVVRVPADRVVAP